MERNQVIGLFLIGAILIGWQFFNQPSAEELQAQKRQQDSIAQVTEQMEAKAEAAALQQKIAQKRQDSLVQTNDSLRLAYDSLAQIERTSKYGAFSSAANGTEELTVVETDLIKATFNNKGGYLTSVELKDFKTHDTLPLYLFKGDSSYYDLKFVYQNKNLSSRDLFFTPVQTAGDKSTLMAYRAYAGSKDKYIEFSYSLPKDNYMIDFNINFVGLPDLLANNGNKFKLNWNLASLAKEKGRQLENQGTTFFYKYFGENADYLSETSEDDQVLEQKTNWIAFKQQFFSVSLIGKNGFVANESNLKVIPLSEHSKYTKRMTADLSMLAENGSIPMQIYLGPNNYNILNEYDLDLEDQINLGWGIFRWISKGLIIPLFDILSGWGLPVILIIVILTFFIKALLFPITYKTYLSSAKMKALKPEIEEINEKYKDKEGQDMKKQQEVMALYRETGVNPFAGCIPMLIQFPVLIAMYRFFPSAIELRQEKFLWANDLSTYDSILALPWDIPMYGDHISGFTLLMAISMIFYTRNNTSMNTMSGPQAQQMKIMTYMMPIMMVVWFNNFSAGLSIYYFIANITTMGQQWVIKKFIIDEDKLHQKIQENKKKPKKKSKFAQKLEEFSNQAQQQQQNRQQRRKK